MSVQEKKADFLKDIFFEASFLSNDQSRGTINKPKEKKNNHKIEK